MPGKVRLRGVSPSRAGSPVRRHTACRLGVEARAGSTVRQASTWGYWSVSDFIDTGLGCQIG